MSLSEGSNQNSVLSENQNLEQINDLNLDSKISNLAEPSFSSYDRDDSLYDAMSFDAQTPFKMENNQEQAYAKFEQNNLNSYRESLNDHETNRYSLIDLEFIKSSRNSKEDQTDLMLDLKDTSIDEILLIADDTHTGRMAETSRLRNASPSKIPVLAKNLKNSPQKSNLSRFQSIENYQDLDCFQGMRRNEQTPSPNFQYNNNQNDTLEFNESVELKDLEQNVHKNNAGKSNLERLKERINSINFNDNRKKNDGFEIMKTPQPVLVDDEFMNPNDGTIGSKDQGAFKLYTTNFDENSNEAMTQIFKDADKKSNQNHKKSNPVSPFFSLDKQSNQKTDFKPKRGPVKKYRSGSTSNLNATNNNERPQSDIKKSTNKQNSERIRPATHNEITYSVDSDESTIVDNLINDPERLKKKLKQSRIEREQLNQLQQNYTRLLQQYAEAENFIDAFRLNGQIVVNSSNPTPVVKGSLLANDSKSQTNAGFQPNYTQPSICSSTATLSSNQLNNDKTNSLNGSKTVLITDQSNQFSGKQTISLIKAQSNDNLNQNKEFVFKSQSTNNFLPVDNLNRNKSQSTVYVIPTKNRPNSESEAKSPTINETNIETKIPIAEEENIVIDQTSTLGILVQIKVLEDKMQSFVTLVNEKQLNKFEQRQVYDSIKNDYHILIQNYNEIKNSNSDNLVQEQIEMDVDLNKELGKMKTLLDNIVYKMNDNLIDELSECTDESDKQSLEYSSIATFYDNQGEMMDQYNRLLDVFNDEKQATSDSSSKKPANVKQKTKKQEQNEHVILSKQQKERDLQENMKINKQEDKKRNIQTKLNESTSEIVSKLANNNKTVNNRNTKVAENMNKLSNSKKLSRISVDRMDQFENEDSINLAKKHAKQQLNRNLNNNRRLTKMSNESSTSTLSTSENESTQINYYENELKPSFKNYIDEIDETMLDKTPVRQDRKPENKKKETLIPKHLEERVIPRSKKPEIKQISDIGSSDQEHDVTIKKFEPSQKPKKIGHQTKSVSIVSLYDQPRGDRRNELRQEPKQNLKNIKKNIDMKNLPVAKAYEGSDSLEDIDSSLSLADQHHQYASSALVRDENLKRNIHVEKRQDLHNNRQKPSNRNSQNDVRYENVRKYDTNGARPFREEMVPKNKRSSQKQVEIEDDSSIFTSDVDSIIERKRALKSSKKDLMKKLAEEVEFLKQEILKKNRNNSKPNENERNKQRSEYTNSDLKQSAPDTELSLTTIDKKEEAKPLDNNKLNKKSEKKSDPKLQVQNNVLIQNNQKILVVRNEFGEKKYFCLMTESGKSPKEKRNVKNLSSDSTSTLCSNSSNEIKKYKQKQQHPKHKDNRPMEKSKYYSVSNLTEIKNKNNKRLDDYFSDEEIEHQVYQEQKIKPNRHKKYPIKDKRYQSSNDIFDHKCYNTRSLNDFVRTSSKNRSQNLIIRELDDRKSEYSFPIVMDSGKKRPIPVVIGKPVHKSSKSRDCLIFLPVQNQDLVNNMPINLIPYPIKEPIINDNLDHNYEGTIKNLTNPKTYKYASSQQINEEMYTSPITLDESAQEKKARRVRYYIREYTDISTVSDNEMMYRRFDEDETDLFDRDDVSNSVDLDILVDQAMTYAHCITNNARRIRNKLSTS